MKNAGISRKKIVPIKRNIILSIVLCGLASTGLYEMMRNSLDKDGSLPGKKIKIARRRAE